MVSQLAKASLADRLRSLSPAQLDELRRKAALRCPSGHALLAGALAQCGIRRVYGIPGTPVDRAFAECAARSIRPVSVANQQAAVLMAAAGNYVAGRMEAAVLVSAGPAVTNTLTGVLVAKDNGWPVLVMGGRRALAHQGIGYFQELDAVPIFTPVARLAETVRSTAGIASSVRRAFSVANTPRRGPVYLDFPEDVLDGHAAPGHEECPALSTRPAAGPGVVQSAAELMLKAKRPLLILGEDIRWSLKGEALRKLVEGCGLPFITTPMARGCLPDDHPLCLNTARRWCQSRADVILMAGAWFDWRFRFGAELAANVQIIHADSDPATLGKNVSPAIAALAEPGEFLAQAGEALRAEVERLGGRAPWKWHEAPVRTQEAAGNAQGGAQERPGKLSPEQLYATLRRLMPGDAIITLEGNITLAAAQKALVARQPASWLDPGRNGLIGGAIPFAMGAKLACPERPVIALCSDTGFGLSAMNLEAAVRHAIPIVVVIANNDGNSGSTRQRTFFPDEYPERFAQFLPGLRYEQIARAFGASGECVTEAAQIAPAFERALAAGAPACLNVQVDPDAAHGGSW